MGIAAHIRGSLITPDFAVKSYVEDLSDEEMLVRPVPNANHIKWQLGHLIASQNYLIEQACPGVMPPLPAGFAEKYNKDTATVDDPNAFDSKEDLMQLWDSQRKGMLAALDKLSDEELEKPAPESLQRFAPTVGGMFAGQSMHWMMHAGQWAVIRRKLGRKPLF